MPFDCSVQCDILFLPDSDSDCFHEHAGLRWLCKIFQFLAGMFLFDCLC